MMEYYYNLIEGRTDGMLDIETGDFHQLGQ